MAKPGRGPICLFIAAILFSGMAVGVKLASERIPAGQIVMYRFLFGLAVLHVLAAMGFSRISHNKFRLQLMRGIAGGIAIVFYFISIEHTTLLKSTLLGNSYPVFAALFGMILLGERIKLQTVAVFLVSIIGVWLVVTSRTEGAASQLTNLANGDLFGIASGAVAGLAIVYIRQLRRTENSFSIFWYLCAVGVVLGAASCLFQPYVLPNLREWLLIGWIGLSSTAAQLLITYGFRYTPAAEGALIANSTVLYSGFAGWIFFGDRMTGWGLLGAALMFAGVVYLSTAPSATPRAEAVHQAR